LFFSITEQEHSKMQHAPKSFQLLSYSTSTYWGVP